jgi:uncharacterized protein YndB with AHSA1/START domain
MLSGKAEMSIRRPVASVFEAFIDPAVTSKFWFTGGSGKLEIGKTVRWDWATYGFSLSVIAKAIEQDRRILVEWAGAGQPPTTVEWTSRPAPTGPRT